MSSVAPKHTPDAADQVGGHGGKQGLVFEGSLILKPALMPKELAFYQKTLDAKRDPATATLFPRYYGLEERDTEWGKIQYMKMENITTPMKKPSVLDLKIGTRTWDADCSAEKKEGHIKRAEETTSVMYGFVFCGMKVYNAKTKAHTKYPKNFGWDARSDELMLKALSTFLHDGERLRVDLIAKWLPKLVAIREFYARGHWQMFAASLLFAYDEVGGAEPDLRLIDFAHSWDMSGKENPKEDPSGFLIGIDNVVKFLKKLQTQH